MIKSILDVTNVVYINLKHRVDRKCHVEKQLNAVGFKNFVRFDAIKMKFGALGCSLSHLNCLEIAKKITGNTF
jgi:GR25 family glycosyltransferase involved in LPS biosynthesis